MVAYDLLMVGVLVGYTIFGAWKGMAWQIATLASIIVSYFMALNFSDSLAPMLSDQAPWNRFLAMLVIFTGTSLVIWLGFRAVSGFITRVKLKEFDRQIGAMFGMFKGVLACVAITFFVVTLSATAREVVLQSRSGHYIAVLLDKADPFMPAEIHQVLGPYLDKLQENLEPGRTPDFSRPGLGSSAPVASGPSDAHAVSLFDLQQIRGLAQGLQSQHVDNEQLRWVEQNAAWLQGVMNGGASRDPQEQNLIDRMKNMIDQSPELQRVIQDAVRSSAGSHDPFRR